MTFLLPTHPLPVPLRRGWALVAILLGGLCDHESYVLLPPGIFTKHARAGSWNLGAQGVLRTVTNTK